jgi:hypothetical protein
MANEFIAKNSSERWHLLVGAAKRTLERAGYTMTRVPGRGLSNVWTIEKDGKKETASIRTTRDRWIAFPPLAGGTKWKTLDDVTTVIVASVDDRLDPQAVEVYKFDAKEVRKSFADSYAARIGAGHKVDDNFGMWVALDEDTRGMPASIGAGLAVKHPPIETHKMIDLIDDVTVVQAGAAEGAPATEELGEPVQLVTIAEVMTWARGRVAELAGVTIDAVKLELKVEY